MAKKKFWNKSNRNLFWLIFASIWQKESEAAGKTIFFVATIYPWYQAIL